MMTDTLKPTAPDFRAAEELLRAYDVTVRPNRTHSEVAFVEDLARLFAYRRVCQELTAAPIPMRLPCPGTIPDGHGGLRPCGQLHVDAGEFATKPHHTHSCQHCGMTWRPSVRATVGVAFLPGFKNTEAPT